MRITWLCLAMLSAGVLGCGPDGLPNHNDDLSAPPEDMAVPIGDIGIPDDAQRLVTFTMFAQDFANALCAKYVMCGKLDAAQMAACVQRNLRRSGWDQDVEIMKGRMAINELQCLDALKNSRCDQSDAISWQSRCLQFLYIGRQTKGAACLATDECTSGLYCQHAGSDAGIAEQVTGCPGTCADPKPNAAPCRLDSDCLSGYICDSNSGNTCVKQAALNEACYAPFANAPDGTKQGCQFGLMCPTYPSTLPAKCILPITQANLDGACDPYQGVMSPVPACAAGMYCQVQYDAGNVSQGGLCKMKIATNGACDPKNEGGFIDFGDSQCADGNICYSSTMKCQPYGAIGADCVKFGGTLSTCKQALTCDTSTVPAKCKALIPDGQACASSVLCMSVLPGQATCIADNADAGAYTTCQSSKSFGAACLPGFEDSLCAASDNAGTTYCAPTSGGKGVCAPKCF